MHSRLTPQGRTLRFIFVKGMAWTVGAAALAGGVVATGKTVGPSFSAWWHSERQATAPTSPPAMATTSREPPHVTYPEPVKHEYNADPPTQTFVPVPVPSAEPHIYEERRTIVIVPKVRERPKYAPPHGDDNRPTTQPRSHHGGEKQASPRVPLPPRKAPPPRQSSSLRSGQRRGK